MSNTRKWFASGDPWIWMIGGALTVSLLMVIGLIGLIAVRGFGHFWPAELIETKVRTASGEIEIVLGEITDTETLTPLQLQDTDLAGQADGDALTSRAQFKVGNRDVFSSDFRWILEPRRIETRVPDDAIMLERREYGNFYGYLVNIKRDGEVIARGDNAFDELKAMLEKNRAQVDELEHIDRYEIGAINYRLEQARLDERGLEFNRDKISAREYQQRMAEIEAERETARAQYKDLREQRDALMRELNRASVTMRTADGREKEMKLSNLIRATRNNAMSVFEKTGYYLVKFKEFVLGYPREANTEGGIMPAIFGTITMVLLMSIVVTPFGVIAAIYLREYARQGTFLRIVRISVYNLAGVPSIVFGVFGLGFFVYTMGGSIDALFYPERAPQPVFGTPGLLWASLTLALLTLPVVIVATEEGLTRIPRAVREGSLALGATKAETLRRIVLPMAAPAMMTGLILAVARAAGEVAPLMLVGVVKLAPALPIDGEFPFLHLERKIMHLGFHIYDVGFQSPNVEAARPLVYATSLMLLFIIISLNLTAISIRNRLRERFRADSD
ncbi:phosphate ABC transporter permease PstA [Algiphilus sp. NNCM1]|uniref:phosphate ABC transporter permease PstA n=1 Tax=Algiphilus sp. TaxID=1872431 RepID=UPI001CA6486D|nr:phosphate ABC transporter permease PstA [Algiphilus sp.]MBY8965300.1 phosphate ABC transporter permease PstA [Algiphilus acroporae]MCI5061649.1 phosphate ABC transporter permease PstA [Algiphilus sp.]MCI5103908.1 phosphate ABC transporter permease PstA [Algiphilus sp.]